MPCHDVPGHRQHRRTCRLQRPELVLAGLWLVFATIGAARFPWHGLWHDDACYIGLGRALTAGSYHLPQLPGISAETRYPPLHPAALALCWLAGADAARAWLFVVPGLIVASLGILAWGLVLRVHLRHRPGPRLVALALAAFAPGWLQVVICAMAEPWLFTLLPLALLVLGRDGERHPGRAGLLFGAAVLAKSIALAPLLAVAARLGCRRRPGAATRLLAGAAVLALPWWVWVSAHPSTGESTILRYYQGYGGLLVHDLTTWLAVLPDRLRDLSTGTVRQAIAGVFLPEVWPQLPAAVRTTLLFLASGAAIALLASVARRAIAGPPVFAAACGLWCISLGVVDASWRYALPALPVAGAVIVRWSGRAWPWLAAACALLSLPATIPLLQFDPGHAGRMWREDVPTAGYDRLAAAVREHTPPDAVIAAELDAWLHLQTGRRAVMPAPMPEHAPCHADDPAFTAHCHREWDLLGVTHFVVDPRTEGRERIFAGVVTGDLEVVDCGLPPGFWLLQRR